LEKRIVVACAQRRQHSTDAVDQTDPLGNQFATFPHSPPRIFIGLVRDRHHRTDAGLATKPSQQGAQEQLGVNAVRLRPTHPPIGQYTGGLHDVNLNALRDEPASQPEPRPTGFVDGDYLYVPGM
jgi:hypothetical protein